MKKFSKKNIKKKLKSFKLNKKTKKTHKKNYKKTYKNMKGGGIIEMIYSEIKKIGVYKGVHKDKDKDNDNDKAKDKHFLIDRINEDVRNLIERIHEDPGSKKIISIEQKLKELPGIIELYNTMRISDYFNKLSSVILSFNIIKYIKEIVEEKPVLELNAGLGLWSSILTRMGCNITSLNNKYVEDGDKYNKSIRTESYLKPKYIHKDEIKKINACKILFLCNPPKDEMYNGENRDDIIYDPYEDDDITIYIKNNSNYLNLKKFTETNEGAMVIYIGNIIEINKSSGARFLEYLINNWEKKDFDVNDQKRLEIPQREIKVKDNNDGDASYDSDSLDALNALYGSKNTKLKSKLKLNEYLGKFENIKFYIYTRKPDDPIKSSDTFYTHLKFLVNFGLTNNSENNIKYLLDYVNNKFQYINSLPVKKTDSMFIITEQKKYQLNTAWATPTFNVIKYIKEIVEEKPVLEIGAGYGLWAALLKMVGCNIIATDDYSWMKHNNGTSKETYTDIENISYGDALAKYNEYKILFLCWPHPKGYMTYNTLQKFTEGNKGETLIYIGEEDFTITGGINFQKYLEKNWIVKPIPDKEELIMPNFTSGIQTSTKISIYTRKPETPIRPIRFIRPINNNNNINNNNTTSNIE